MKKIEKLTPEQKQKLTEFRAEMFAQATSTAPADRPRAEAAARRIAEIAGVQVKSVIWVSTPEQGAAAYAAAWASLSDSLWDTSWLSFYAFPSLHMGVEYPPEALEKLNLHREIGASCFAMWLVPGTVILCDRPEKVEVVDGKVVGLSWRTQAVAIEAAKGGGK